MGSTVVNREGYLVMHQHPTDGRRTYACGDLPSLQRLVERLTGRDWSTFSLDLKGLPRIDGLTIAYPLHIYGEV